MGKGHQATLFLSSSAFFGLLAIPWNGKKMIATVVIAPNTQLLNFFFLELPFPYFCFPFSFTKATSDVLSFFSSMEWTNLLSPYQSTPFSFLLGSAIASTTFLHTGTKKVQTFCHGDGGREISLNVGPDLLLYGGSQVDKERQKDFFLSISSSPYYNSWKCCTYVRTLPIWRRSCNCLLDSSVAMTSSKTAYIAALKSP